MARGGKDRRRRSSPEAVATRLEARAKRMGTSADAHSMWRSAADAWRQADRPVRAIKALSHVLRDGVTDAVAGALLAGLLQDVGQLMAARSAADDAVTWATGLGPMALALDVSVGVRLLLGELDEARSKLTKLAGLKAPGAALSVAFRQARLDRLDGALERASRRLAELEETLAAAGTRAAAPRAAAAQEQAELALLLNDPLRARMHLERAVTAWDMAGRRPGRFGAEGLSVRIGLAEGTAVMPAALDNPISFATERSMVLLEAELRVARARARAQLGQAGASEDFDAAVAHGQASEARFLEGRARLWRRASGHGLSDDLARTRLLLGADAVYRRHPVLRARPN